MKVYMGRALSINVARTSDIVAERSGSPLTEARELKTELRGADFLEEIYNRYYKNVYNYISFRINHHFEAEELANTVFEKAVRGLQTYKTESANPEAWLIGIAKNTVTDYLRSKKRKVFIPFDFFKDGASPDKGPEEIIVVKEENLALIKAMSKLKDKERQALSMKFATDLKSSEIARLLGISEANVRVVVHRSLKKLRKIMETGVEKHE